MKKKEQRDHASSSPRKKIDSRQKHKVKLIELKLIEKGRNPS